MNRTELLAEAAAGRVWLDVDLRRFAIGDRPASDQDGDELCAMQEEGVIVCGVSGRLGARELRDAGWIEVGLYRSYRLTEQGRDVVAGVTHPSDQAGGA